MSAKAKGKRRQRKPQPQTSAGPSQQMPPSEPDTATMAPEPVPSSLAALWKPHHLKEMKEAGKSPAEWLESLEVDEVKNVASELLEAMKKAEESPAEWLKSLNVDEVKKVAKELGVQHPKTAKADSWWPKILAYLDWLAGMSGEELVLYDYVEMFKHLTWKQMKDKVTREAAAATAPGLYSSKKEECARKIAAYHRDRRNKARQADNSKEARKLLGRAKLWDKVLEFKRLEHETTNPELLLKKLEEEDEEESAESGEATKCKDCDGIVDSDRQKCSLCHLGLIPRAASDWEPAVTVKYDAASGQIRGEMCFGKAFHRHPTIRCEPGQVCREDIEDDRIANRLSVLLKPGKPKARPKPKKWMPLLDATKIFRERYEEDKWITILEEAAAATKEQLVPDINSQEVIHKFLLMIATEGVQKLDQYSDYMPYVKQTGELREGYLYLLSLQLTQGQETCTAAAQYKATFEEAKVPNKKPWKFDQAILDRFIRCQGCMKPIPSNAQERHLLNDIANSYEDGVTHHKGKFLRPKLRESGESCVASHPSRAGCLIRDVRFMHTLKSAHEEEGEEEEARLLKLYFGADQATEGAKKGALAKKYPEFFIANKAEFASGYPDLVMGGSSSNGYLTKDEGAFLINADAVGWHVPESKLLCSEEAKVISKIFRLMEYDAPEGKTLHATFPDHFGTDGHLRAAYRHWRLWQNQDGQHYLYREKGAKILSQPGDADTPGNFNLYEGLPPLDGAEDAWDRLSLGTSTSADRDCLTRSLGISFAPDILGAYFTSSTEDAAPSDPVDLAIVKAVIASFVTMKGHMTFSRKILFAEERAIESRWKYAWERAANAVLRIPHVARNTYSALQRIVLVMPRAVAILAASGLLKDAMLLQILTNPVLNPNVLQLPKQTFDRDIWGSCDLLAHSGEFGRRRRILRDMYSQVDGKTNVDILEPAAVSLRHASAYTHVDRSYISSHDDKHLGDLSPTDFFQANWFWTLHRAPLPTLFAIALQQTVLQMHDDSHRWLRIKVDSAGNAARDEAYPHAGLIQVDTCGPSAVDGLFDKGMSLFDQARQLEKPFPGITPEPITIHLVKAMQRPVPITTKERADGALLVVIADGVLRIFPVEELEVTKLQSKDIYEIKYAGDGQSASTFDSLVRIIVKHIKLFRKLEHVDEDDEIA